MKNGIINFDKINKKNNNDTTNENKSSSYNIHVQQKDNKINKEAELIKIYGEKEIVQFNEFLKDFIKNVKTLAIFSGVTEKLFIEGVDFFCTEEIMKAIVIPVFHDKRDDTPYLDEATFDRIRKEMIEALIKQYIVKSKK